MEEHRSARRIKQAGLTGAPAPAAASAAAAAREEPLEPRPEERGGGEPPLPPLPPCPDPSEKTSAATSGRGEIVSGNPASSSGPSEPPRSSAGSDEESVGAAKAKLGAAAVDRQQQAKSFETEAPTCNSDFRLLHVHSFFDFRSPLKFLRRVSFSRFYLTRSGHEISCPLSSSAPPTNSCQSSSKSQQRNHRLERRRGGGSLRGRIGDDGETGGSCERREASRGGGDAVASGAGIVLLGGGEARAAAIRGQVQLRHRHGRPARRSLRVDPLEAVTEEGEREREKVTPR